MQRRARTLVGCGFLWFNEGANLSVLATKRQGRGGPQCWKHPSLWPPILDFLDSVGQLALLRNIVQSWCIIWGSRYRTCHYCRGQQSALRGSMSVLESGPYVSKFNLFWLSKARYFLLKVHIQSFHDGLAHDGCEESSCKCWRSFVVRELDMCKEKLHDKDAIWEDGCISIRVDPGLL